MCYLCVKSGVSTVWLLGLTWVRVKGQWAYTCSGLHLNKGLGTFYLIHVLNNTNYTIAQI